MCGITGIWQLKQSEGSLEQKIRRMTRAIAHRGPDDEGVWSNHAIALGHRRLAIVDLSPTGHQPMVSSDGRYVLVFNGEIYNYKRLAQALRKENIPCEERNDTQVLLQCCAYWGIKKTLGLLNGMFAFAIYDRQEKILSLARDRMGEKPLYYSFEPNHYFAFGSELKALKTLPEVKQEIDPTALDLYLNFNYVPSPHSWYKGIKKLLPGRYLTVTEKGLREETYFDLEVSITKRSCLNLSENEIIQKLDTLLTQSVQDRMVADVPLGAFLSGGIDSSLMVALMQKQSTVPIKTFTVGFKNSPWDESNYAEAIAKHLKTDHKTLYIEPEEILSYASQISKLYDEPFGDPSALPTHVVSKLFRQYVTVAIGGDGGDELFAGYHRHKWVPALHTMSAYIPDSWLRFLGKVNKYLLSNTQPVLSGKIKKALLALEGETFLETYLNSLRCFSGKVNLEATWFKFHPHLANTAEQVSYLDMRHYLHDDVLCKVDRASMAVGLETRAPFLDYELLDFAWSIPLSQKFPRKNKKYLLKKVLGSYIPQSLWDRPKMGFGMPLSEALRTNLKSSFEAYLKADTMIWQHLDRLALKELWDQHVSGRVSHESCLWNFFVAQQCLLA